MQAFLVKKIPFLLITSTLMFLPLDAAQAQLNEVKENYFFVSQRAEQTRANLFSGNTAPTIVNAGTVNTASDDHFFEVEVKGEPLDRLKVVCVTFHELSGIKVIDTNSGEEIPYSVEYGFEEFIITFDRPVELGTTVRTIVEDSTVRGANDGIVVPYRIFSVSRDLGEIPIGTAIVSIPDND